VDRLRETAIWGTADTVAAKLTRLASNLQASEVAVITTVHDKAARQRSYTLLAQAARLRPEVALAAE